MSSMAPLAESIQYEPGKGELAILNQLLLPSKVEYIRIGNTEDAWNGIRQMMVRGAPAIAIVGLLSVAVELSDASVVQSFAGDHNRLLDYLRIKADYLCTSRPTAVNIRKEFDALLAKVEEKAVDKLPVSQLVQLVRAHCFDALELDRQTNRKIGDLGARHILGLAGGAKKVSILTHCNTGSLATAGYGTALGVIRSLHSAGMIERVYCTETRPYNQGSRLTAWELVTEGIPATLVCDNMVALLMHTRRIDAVVVGADRVVANGDTANKIGTFQIALLCRAFQVPFLVASPMSTIDWSIPDGSKIVIEERKAEEMRLVGGVPIAPSNVHCWNPAFDVTPAHLIHAIITEHRVVGPDDLVAKLKP